ncbi:mitochondrial protein import protein ZIM17 [Drosophila hydei]|uniref:Mitochondrial protein import protein ZIM17 n=1 Tax=Drosophila hydei TaxID=7224 RepID=A0A6J1M9M8_DROHY|nr:mitochondrial protein import protein ZIM17 [Drosophila hydei]
MNALRNIFTSRTLNYLRQNGQNAILNATQQQGPVPLSDADADKALNDVQRSTLSIPRSILDACRFTAKPFEITGSVAGAKPKGSLSPTTLKRFRRMQRRMEIVYLCKLCNTRNTKTISEEAYNSGVVILQCDGCAVDHLIKDNLGLFSNRDGSSSGSMNIDEVLSNRQERVRIIKVNEHGELI